jgi:hypothetical protein
MYHALAGCPSSVDRMDRMEHRGTMQEGLNKLATRFFEIAAPSKGRD